MNSKIINLIIISLCALFVCSCGGKVIYQETIDISDPWSKTDSISFQYDIVDTLVPYDLILKVEHSPSFGYENLYLMVNTKFPDGQIKRGPLSLQLANNNGSWIGDCNDESCTIKIHLSSIAYFKTPGLYTLSFAQFSRESQLSGIKKLTLSVQQSHQ